MPSTRRICFDRLLPRDLRAHQRTRAGAGGRLRALSPIHKQWPNGSTLRIRFLGGSEREQGQVRDVAPEWTRHANLHFEFSDDPRSEVRVSFDPGDGAWSYVGTDNQSIPLHAATLNLGWVDEGVILHEFGHMIGLAHEHQNPEGGIVWNEDVVIRDLSGPPNYWDEATIRHNVLNRYSVDQIHGTEFDPDSVMLYAFPDEWTQNPGGTRENDSLSDLDKAFVRSAQMYPGRAAPTEQATPLSVWKGLEAAIAKPGEQDLYRFEISESGLHTVETTGSTDLILALYGPDNPTQLLAEDDDGGSGLNPRITAVLTPGQYLAQVRHYDPERSGSYRIRVYAH